MKKYIKLEKHISNDSLYYKNSYSSKELETLNLFISETSPDRFLKQINKKGSFGYDNETTNVDWSHKKNQAIIQIDDFYQIDGNPYPFIMTLKNFKEILETWRFLKNKQVENIYFIEQDDGSIIVQDHL